MGVSLAFPQQVARHPKAWFAKPLSSRYRPRDAGWVKYRPTDTADAAVVAVTGTARRPQAALVRLSDGTELLTSPARGTVQARALSTTVAGLLGAPRQHPGFGRILPLTEPLPAEIRMGTGRHRTATFVRLRSAAG